MASYSCAFSAPLTGILVFLDAFTVPSVANLTIFFPCEKIAPAFACGKIHLEDGKAMEFA
jgi:hypothetical protein